MKSPRALSINGAVIVLLALATFILLPGCSVNVKKDEGGQSKKVDIETPIGGIHVSKDAEAKDTGLPVYPGARKKETVENGEEKSANVNISTAAFGLKVVAIEYESDVAPEKIIAYYKDQLKKYGNVLVCHTRHHGGDVSAHAGKHGSEHTKDLKCEGDNSGDVIELKAGTEDNQHLVAIEPAGKGSTFALVYVQTRGDETI